jgi:hypothetical protein
MPRAVGSRCSMVSSEDRGQTGPIQRLCLGSRRGRKCVPNLPGRSRRHGAAQHVPQLPYGQIPPAGDSVHHRTMPNPLGNVEHVVAADGRQIGMRPARYHYRDVLVFSASRIVGICALGTLRVITSTLGANGWGCSRVPRILPTFERILRADQLFSLPARFHPLLLRPPTYLVVGPGISMSRPRMRFNSLSPLKCCKRQSIKRLTRS